MTFEPLKQQLLARLSRLASIGLWWRDPPPGYPCDPHAGRPAPLRPRPHRRSGAVALEEPRDGE